MSELREDLKKAHAQHKQQLAEMALLQEEEKQRATLDKQASLDRLERNHQQEKDAAHEKVRKYKKWVFNSVLTG